MKNSLLLGLMPTASSAILLGAFECFEPVTSNLFTRMVGDGEFIVVNKYLARELDELDLWTEGIRDQIVANKFIDQSQSLNVYHKDAKYSKISSALVYAWKKGLKTGSYYTRTESKLGKNKKLSASENTVANAPNKPENSMFVCAGGGCDA